MKIIDTKNELTTTSVSDPAARTSTVTSSGMDLRDYEGIVAVVEIVGTVSGSSPTLDGKIQDSADNSTFADVSGLTNTQVTASTSKQTIAVDSRAVKRYIRYVGTIGGSTPSFGMCVVAIGQKKTI